MTLPLRIDDLGVVRIGATRVTLDTFVGSYRDSSTAEEIVHQFPSWPLTGVHAANLGYFFKFFRECFHNTAPTIFLAASIIRSAAIFWTLPGLAYRDSGIH